MVKRKFFGNKLLIAKSLKQQAQAIQRRWPGFTVTLNGGILTATGQLRPTARSRAYEVQISYKLKKNPDIILLNPKIECNFKGEMPEHLYSQERLCLFRPIYGEFKFSDFLSETILPWIALWLYHYEVWHLTGDWLGGGEHPN
ncbi:hypothetical protein ACFE6N_06315 [Pedobacter sp. BG31]|uniref:hypothetical protein n=1 Tax=Pedobacter sp. BG31 TaxID=3349697 RepID=UPI0035F382DF